MAKKSGTFALLVRGIVIFTFLFLENRMYKDYEKVKRVVDDKRETMYTQVIGSFIRREENFYKNKEYLKADFAFKEKKRIEAEEKRLEALKRMEEYRRLQDEKLAKEQEMEKQEENIQLAKVNLNNNIEKPLTVEKEIKPEVKKEIKKTPTKKVIPRGAVTVKKTKLDRIEDVTTVPKEVRSIKIHRVETNVRRLKDDDEDKKEQKTAIKEITPIKKEEPKKEENKKVEKKTSTFKEIKPLEN